MSTRLTGGGSVALWVALGMIVGIIFDSRDGDDGHRGLVLGMVFGAAFGVVAGLRRSGSSGPAVSE